LLSQISERSFHCFGDRQFSLRTAPSCPPTPIRGFPPTSVQDPAPVTFEIAGNFLRIGVPGNPHDDVDMIGHDRHPAQPPTAMTGRLLELREQCLGLGLIQVNGPAIQ